jgi:hypothetical protein
VAADERWAWKELDGPRWWAQLAHDLTADRLGAADHHRRSGALDGIDLRHPLRDPGLVDHVLSLPPELGFDPRLDRPLARRALAGELPERFLLDPRKPFFNRLLEDALRGPDAETVRELLAHPRPELSSLLRPEAVKALENGLFPTSSAAPGAATDVWRIAVLELWLRHGDGSS